jgi:hypothetical protein
MKQDTIQKLDNEFLTSPVTAAGPVPVVDVLELERQVGFLLPTDYNEFVVRYGGGIVGPYPVYGVRASGAMSPEESSAMGVTRSFRNQQWPGTENWLVISSDHAGNPFGIDSKGRVWISDHDAGIVEVAASGFEEFIRVKCMGLTG